MHQQWLRQIESKNCKEDFDDGYVAKIISKEKKEKYTDKDEPKKCSVIISKVAILFKLLTEIIEVEESQQCYLHMARGGDNEAGCSKVPFILNVNTYVMKLLNR